MNLRAGREAGLLIDLFFQVFDFVFEPRRILTFCRCQSVFQPLQSRCFHLLVTLGFPDKHALRNVVHGLLAQFGHIERLIQLRPIDAIVGEGVAVGLTIVVDPRTECLKILSSCLFHDALERPDWEWIFPYRNRHHVFVPTVVPSCHHNIRKNRYLRDKEDGNYFPRISHITELSRVSPQ